MEGDFCGFCSYGTVSRPPVQLEGENVYTGLLRLTCFSTEVNEMKNIKVLGSGCKNCETVYNLIRIAADQAGTEVELEKITDIAEIMGYGVMSTPGVVVDGEVVHAGGLPGPDQVRQWVKQS